MLCCFSRIEHADQARTYDQFVHNTEFGTEWGTQMTVCALARGLGIGIFVVSTTGNDSAFVQGYFDGVHRTDIAIYVG